PQKYIVYPGGNTYYIDEKVELSILEQGFEVDTFKLQDLFWPFVDPKLKRMLFSFRNIERRKFRPISRKKLSEMQSSIHEFDKRRFHFLRFGCINQGDINDMPYRFYNRLLNKCRDEIEQLIWYEEERCLKSGEYKYYVYAALNLARFFPKNRMATMAPYALDQDKMDEYFLQEICILNRDKTFFDEHDPDEGLSEYLKRYVIMYFDNQFTGSSYVNESFYEYFSKRYKQNQFTPTKDYISIKESCRILGIKEEDYKKMTLKEFKKTFRRLAHKCHPDKGGEHEKFLRVCQAYESLLEDKQRRSI
ncbi:MAG: hypothetical protein D6828_00455, partial [Nitrospirae bacterium]